MNNQDNETLTDSFQQEDRNTYDSACENYQIASLGYIRPGTHIDRGILEMGRLLREKDATIAALREELYELKTRKNR